MVAVTCDGTGTAELVCSDVYGNQGGDWVGCIAGQDGIDGNISEDPLFCDWQNRDLRLQEESPCAPEHNPCGLVGFWTVGCDVAIPAVSVWGMLLLTLLVLAAGMLVFMRQRESSVRSCRR